VFYYLLAVVVILFDQVTKWVVVQTMRLGQGIPIIENFFYLTSHRNRGAAWGILEGQMWFFYIITVIVIVFVVYYLQTQGKKQPLLGTALALILGGAIGNFIDRLFRKEVVDFLDVYIFSYDYPIFNIADSALVVGVGLIIVQTFLDSRSVKEKV
jgi:signal peptidase II